MKRDNQRTAVYAWEVLLPEYRQSKPKLTLPECAALIRRVWADWIGPDAEPPEVKDGRGCRSGAGCRSFVRLPKATRYTMYIMHEVAHSIQDYHDSERDDFAWHDPVFVRLYLDLAMQYVPVFDVWNARDNACGTVFGTRQRVIIADDTDRIHSWRSMAVSYNLDSEYRRESRT